MNEKHLFCSSEFEDHKKINSGGRGFYNEFGIDSAIGYDECQAGQRFHKIGTGMLTKDTEPYFFLKNYDVLPAVIEFELLGEKVVFTVKSSELNGYAYHLKKSVMLDNSSFSIKYELENTGIKPFRTSEYVHNFLCLNGRTINEDYSLKFPFIINPATFTETVNRLSQVSFENDMVNWNSDIAEPFFFSNMNSKTKESSWWELIQKKERIGVKESCYGKVNKVNLWGTRHVVSPELFHPIDLNPGEKECWIRTFDFFNT